MRYQKKNSSFEKYADSINSLLIATSYTHPSFLTLHQWDASLFLEPANILLLLHVPALNTGICHRSQRPFPDHPEKMARIFPTHCAFNLFLSLSLCKAHTYQIDVYFLWGLFCKKKTLISHCYLFGVYNFTCCAADTQTFCWMNEIMGK